METKSFKFTNNKQFEYLYTTMEENLHIARDKVISDPEQNNFSDFWENLADILNKIGPLVRSSSGWQKIWNEHKSFVTKKIKKSPSSEEGSKKLIPLTDLEKGVAQILNPRSYSALPTSVCSSTIADQNAAAALVNTTPYRIKVKASSDNIFEEKLPSKIPQSAKETIIKIQEETHNYLKRMTKIEEERLRIEKRELEEKIKFREELALLVQKVKNDISMSINF